MPAQESEAIILKTFPLGEADRLVSFLSRAHGRLRGVAPGARRLKNRFGSTLEILSHVRIGFFERETRDLVRIQECELLESLHAAQSDYGLATGLAVVSELTEAVLPERESSEAMFRLILLTAREIDRRKSWELPLSYFALWSVKLGGWLPPLDRTGMRGLSAGSRKLAELFLAQRLERIGPELAEGGLVREVGEASLDWLELHIEKKLKSRGLLEKA